MFVIALCKFERNIQFDQIHYFNKSHEREEIIETFEKVNKNSVMYHLVNKKY